MSASFIVHICGLCLDLDANRIRKALGCQTVVAAARGRDARYCRSEPLHLLLLRRGRHGGAIHFGGEVVFERLPRLVVDHVASLRHSWLHTRQSCDRGTAPPLAVLLKAAVHDAALSTACRAPHWDRAHRLLCRHRVPVLHTADGCGALADSIAAKRATLRLGNVRASLYEHALDARVACDRLASDEIDGDTDAARARYCTRAHTV